ncbi:MAG TPA: D-alanyl-D-alanine carboxypeptidase/D-alanyl-D-alanine-endopeptidase, partial [Flavisolibacter sp.]|nr:D-alanyl-D-alanine carboxypeptidase/D-alanyl-D-alanine-endopeptidase [Flavisolibacter sp.]
ATAYELLGRDFRYETKFGYAGTIKNKSLSGNFYVKPSGDPTLGSWRWKSTSDTAVVAAVSSTIKKLGITGFNDITIDDKGWNSEAIPDGWIWQDVGNYYGAGASGFNWRENQYDIVMKSGNNIDDPVSIVKTVPQSSVPLISTVKSAAKGTDDNSYVYYPLLDSKGMVRGTIPVGETAFTISASNPVPENTFTSLFAQYLTKSGIEQRRYENHSPDTTILFTQYSPSLDSIIYWFLKKSVNLYGEALVKTFAYQKNGLGETDKGVQLVKNFWKEKGITSTELNIVDGSGLSPLNRVTTHAQVMVLKYAKAQSWFNGFYNAFPEYNGMKMKSGTINGVKGFCGYQKSKDGNEYIFSFLINNYNGSASAVVQKMYRVLDELK